MVWALLNIGSIVGPVANGVAELLACIMLAEADGDCNVEDIGDAVALVLALVEGVGLVLLLGVVLSVWLELALVDGVGLTLTLALGDAVKLVLALGDTDVLALGVGAGV